MIHVGHKETHRSFGRLQNFLKTFGGVSAEEQIAKGILKVGIIVLLKTSFDETAHTMFAEGSRGLRKESHQEAFV
jgi:hypothetical protein